MNLVCGATGILGGLITFQLLREGKPTRILVRHNSPSEELALKGMATSANTLIKAGAEPVYGDFKDADSLRKACGNVDTIITTANSAMRGGADTVDSVDRQGNRALIEAARKAGVKQFIFISFFGADINHPVPLFRAKAEIESLLKNDQLPYTILAPNFFLESWAGMVIGIPLRSNQPITLVGDGRRRHSFISMADVAAFAVASIGRASVINKRFVLGGPESVSWCELVKIVEAEVKMKIPVHFVNIGENIPGEPDIVPPTLAGMETYDSVIPMEETSKIFGVNQTPITAAVHQMFGGIS